MTHVDQNEHKKSDQYYADLLTNAYFRALQSGSERTIPIELQYIVTQYADLHFLMLRYDISEFGSNGNLFTLSGDEMRTQSLRWLSSYICGLQISIEPPRLWFRFPVLEILYTHNWLCTPLNVCCLLFYPDCLMDTT